MFDMSTYKSNSHYRWTRKSWLKVEVEFLNNLASWTKCWQIDFACAGYNVRWPMLRRLKYYYICIDMISQTISTHQYVCVHAYVCIYVCTCMFMIVYIDSLWKHLGGTRLSYWWWLINVQTLNKLL